MSTGWATDWALEQQHAGLVAALMPEQHPCPTTADEGEDDGPPATPRSGAVVILDIETTARQDWLLTQIPPDAARWGDDDREAWIEDNAASGAGSPFTGQVVCWAAAMGWWSQAPKSHERRLEHGPVHCGAGTDERALLADLLDLLVSVRAATIVAHGGHDFDFPFLRVRAMAHGLPRLARAVYQDKPWGTRLIDTTQPAWSPRPRKLEKHWSFSLNAWAQLFGIQRPPQIDSGAVPAAWYRGELGAIRGHCTDDVVTLRQVYARLAAGRLE